MVTRKMAATFAVAMFFSGAFAGSSAQVPDDFDKGMREALALYEKGNYGSARAAFEALGDDAQSEGYAVLCAVRMNTAGYESLMKSYEDRHGWSGLMPRIRWYHALNLFDAQDYAAAGKQLSSMKVKDVEKEDRPEYWYKRGYSAFEMGDGDETLSCYEKVEGLPASDYTAPARYGTGYILYSRSEFRKALSWFEKSAGDVRFSDVSSYYITECHYMLKDYKYVTDHAEELYARVPSERKPHLARLISESYLIQGEAESARKYYDEFGEGERTRGDDFYAGSLLYTLGDYKGAIENYSKMTDRTDSLGQVAEYNMGYGYIQTHDKVSALDAFRNASALTYDARMQEDAWFNYAKLSFDLNHDGSVFEQYMEKYPKTEKNDLIYSYIALANLYDRDYAGAVAAYDNIDYLDDDMKANYMKANYLRAEQLIRGGSWRQAVPYLKAANFYLPSYDPFSQLSRYWLAESYFRSDDFGKARDGFTELYNASALDGMKEGRLLPYNVAYCYFEDKDYAHASRWYENYLGSGDKMVRRDAMLRVADCDFLSKDYSAAVSSYKAVVEAYPEAGDIYPYYQSGMASGLSGDNKGKVATLEQVRDFSPDKPYYSESLYELGRAYSSLRKSAKAEECYAELVGKGRDSTYIARAMLGLGLISRDRKDYDEALSWYKKVVRMMPSSDYSADALQSIETIYRARGEAKEYIAYVDSLGGGNSLSDSDKEQMLFSAGEQVFLSGNYDKALSSLLSYEESHPEGKYLGKSDYYIAESYKQSGSKEKACDYYRKVMASDTNSFAEPAALSYAELSYGMENYEDALEGYERLSAVARFEQNAKAAESGMVASAYKAGKYSEAVSYADALLADQKSDQGMRLAAKYYKAKSLMTTSRRSEALKLFGEISSETDTPQGAEAAYILIQNDYDKGDFSALEKKVYAFSDSGTGQSYWLAKAFIVLGDSFADRDDYRQARATFESVRDGYTPDGTDDVLQTANMRIAKLDEIGE